MIGWRARLCAAIGLACASAAQAADIPSVRPGLATAAVAPRLDLGTESGFAIFQTFCTSCHGNPNATPPAPDPALLRQMSAEKILDALTTGVMQREGAKLSGRARRRVAEFMAGRPLGSAAEGDAKKMPGQCPGNPALTDPAAGPSWNGWGNGPANSRFQLAAAAGLDADQVPKLKLKWAFGFPHGISAYGQPSVAGGRVYAGSDIGFVYALDAKTGCIYWSFEAKGGVRTAVSIGPVTSHPTTKYAAFFGDNHANVYAVDAQTGALIWTTKVEDHFTARITGAPKLYQDRLYVPISSSEDINAGAPTYPCCTFRGSVVALDAETGAQVWKTYVIPDAPKPRKKNAIGTQLWAPAGASIWDTPTIDPKQHALYVGTGNGETQPAGATSDAILALDLASGKILWSYQAAENDAYIGGCTGPVQTEACPSVPGRDFDIGNSPILGTLPNGHRVVIAGTKDADIFALDPDKHGALVWRVKVAERPARSPQWGFIFGGAADEQTAYYPLFPGRMAALDIASGHIKWTVPLAPNGVRVGYAAAASAIPGVAFVGGSDGKLIALSTSDGHRLWDYDTARDFETVNRVKTKGGSISGPGPIVADGMLFVGSGYSVTIGISGNALLSFAPEP